MTFDLVAECSVRQGGFWFIPFLLGLLVIILDNE